VRKDVARPHTIPLACASPQIVPIDLPSLSFPCDRVLDPNHSLPSEAKPATSSTTSEDAGSLTDPRVAFAFTYLASHFALNLLTERQVAKLMDYIETHPDALNRQSS
jgi:hypothetical protein